MKASLCLESDEWGLTDVYQYRLGLGQATVNHLWNE